MVLADEHTSWKEIRVAAKKYLKALGPVSTILYIIRQSLRKNMDTPPHQGEALEMLWKVHSIETINQPCMCEWHKWFKEGRQDAHEDVVNLQFN